MGPESLSTPSPRPTPRPVSGPPGLQASSETMDGRRPPLGSKTRACHLKRDRKVRPLPRRRGRPLAAHGLAFGPPKSRPGRGQPGGPSGPDARARGGGGGEEAAPRAAARPRPSRVHAKARRGWASARRALTGAGAASAMAARVPRSAALLPGGRRGAAAEAERSRPASELLPGRPRAASEPRAPPAL